MHDSLHKIGDEESMAHMAKVVCGIGGCFDVPKHCMHAGIDTVSGAQPKASINVVVSLARQHAQALIESTVPCHRDPFGHAAGRGTQ